MPAACSSDRHVVTLDMWIHGPGAESAGASSTPPTSGAGARSAPAPARSPAPAVLEIDIDAYLREAVVVLWAAPHVDSGAPRVYIGGDGRPHVLRVTVLIAKELGRSEVHPPGSRIRIPEGAAWGGVYAGDLLMGAFLVKGGVQRLWALSSTGHLRLEGDGAMELLDGREFGRAISEMLAAGVEIPNRTGPPFPLWWVRVGPVGGGGV